MPQDCIVYTEEDLQRSVDSASMLKHRDIVRSINLYLQSNSLQVLGLYGLRRTGKTIAMFHAIGGAGIDKCCYVLCKENCHFSTLIDTISQLKGKVDYIFIDEITRCDDFSDEAYLLSSLFTECGTKIVVAGTDSLQLNMAYRHSLLGRVIMIRRYDSSETKSFYCSYSLKHCHALWV